MKIFISWSGPRSKAVAQALRDWLPNVIQSLEPWMSAADIEAGARWSAAIAGELQASSFGVFCLTPDNVGSPWLHFEAGAIAKQIDKARVVPYLYEVTPTAVQGPLTQFQMKAANQEQTLELVRAINAAMPVPLKLDILDRALNRCWPDLADVLRQVPAATTAAPPAPSTGKILEDVLQTVRAIASQQQAQQETLDALANSEQPFKRRAYFYEDALEAGDPPFCVIDTRPILGEDGGLHHVDLGKKSVMGFLVTAAVLAKKHTSEFGKTWAFRQRKSGNIISSEYVLSNGKMSAASFLATLGPVGVRNALEIVQPPVEDLLHVKAD